LIILTDVLVTMLGRIKMLSVTLLTHYWIRYRQKKIEKHCRISVNIRGLVQQS